MNMSKQKYFEIALVGLLLVGFAFVTLSPKKESSSQNDLAPAAVSVSTDPAPAPDLGVQKTSQLVEPINDAKSRVTKKPFGIFVTPGNSPVTPERFRGFHTGVDFEILPAEENSNVSIRAVCAGKVIFAGFVGGYGGVLVQSCQIDASEVSVLYGHLNLNSLTKKTGADLQQGEFLGILGAPYSKQTDGERKHLHLAIHKGATLEFRGYVQSKTELSAWLDPLSFM